MTKDLCSPADMARWFINRVDRASGEAITHLKLQKLLYFAQAYHLANFNKPLFKEDMQAWAHGPVVPSVWHAYKEHGWNSLDSTDAPDVPEEIEAYLNAVYETFAKFDAKELERLTHEHRPWRETRGDLPPEARCTRPIDKKLIRDFYARKIKKTWPN